MKASPRSGPNGSKPIHSHRPTPGSTADPPRHDSRPPKSKAKWFDNLSRQGNHVPISFPDARFPARWMQQPLRQAASQIQKEAVQFLCHAFRELLGAAGAGKTGTAGFLLPVCHWRCRRIITRQNHCAPFQLIDTLLGRSIDPAHVVATAGRKRQSWHAGQVAKGLNSCSKLRLAMYSKTNHSGLLEQAASVGQRPLIQGALQRSVASLRIAVRRHRTTGSQHSRFDQEQAWFAVAKPVFGIQGSQGMSSLA